MGSTLRPARPDDAKEMARWFADLDELSTWGGPDVVFPLTADQMAKWIGEGAAEKPRLCFTEADEDDVPIGHVQFVREPAKQWARLGRFGIAPSRRGKGAGRALFNASVRFAFTRLDVEHLVLGVVVENTRARALYLSAGFRDEGTWPATRPDGKPWTATLMGLMRQDWLRQAPAETGAIRVN